MRCLYIVANDPISPNYVGGASAMYFDQLMALSDLGHEVHLWHFASVEARDRFDRFIEGEPDVWATVRNRCASIRLTTHSEDTLADRTMGRLGSMLSGGLPAPRRSLRNELRQLLDSRTPAFIWAQHFEPAIVAVQQAHVPVVYVHHDWLYRIKALRNHRQVNPKQLEIEERLVQAVAAVISGSEPECEEIRQAGARHVTYIPVTFELPAPVVTADSPPRLIHLGGMGTTANREGLLQFFERVWPDLKTSGVELQVVGSTSGASPTLQQHLATVETLGFVADLGTVLRPLDIHIIPWEHATGQRTRLPLAFAMSQVVVSTKAAASCYPEAVDGVNCRLVHSLEEMAPAIRSLLSDQDARLRLARAARDTFESCFTRLAVLPRYASVIASLPAPVRL